MKRFILTALVLVMTQNAFAICENIKGKYEVSGEYWGSNGISAPWGSVSIGAPVGEADRCNYPIFSKVKDFAAPIANGKQLLVISKAPGPIGNPFKLLNADETPAGEGSFFRGSGRRLTLSVSNGSCSNEGSASDCGVDLILE